MAQVLSGAAQASPEAAKLVAESRELQLLIGSTQTEIARLKSREDEARAKFETAKGSGGDPGDLAKAADEYVSALSHRMTMDSELAALQAKRKLIERVSQVVADAQRDGGGSSAHSVMTATPASPLDETRLLQAVVDTQEEERRRVARQVHDGPAQAMANVVLQSEISERLFDRDPKRARDELAALRAMVNKTLQELRAFIFELRPMILDDLGLVPTLRRYIQTLSEKHGIRIDLASTGRDRRLQPDEEVAIFRLIQDSLIERIERGGSKAISLAMNWGEEILDIALQSDGKELASDAELSSGLRRSERLELLHGEQQQETRPDGVVMLRVRIPIRAGVALIS